MSTDSQKTSGKSTPITVDKGAGGTPQIPPSENLSGEKKRVNSPDDGNVPRFLIIKRVESNFALVSPFLIDKVLTGQVGEVDSVRKINEGLLVVTKSAIQSKKLLNLKKFHVFDVTVTPHSSLNYSKGVITCRDLLNCSVAEISEHLSDQHVIDVKRITVMRDGKRVESASLILTFNSDKPPKKIKAGFHSITVRPYIPAPLRCFKCQKFGHTSIKCNGKEMCVCGNEPHLGSECPKPPKCINCEGAHASRSKDCPMFKEEMAIQKIKTEEKISFIEARRKVRGTITRPVPNISYAQAVTSPPNQDIVKVIVKELIPEIVQICTKIIKETMQGSPGPSGLNKPKEKRPISPDLLAPNDKRKCISDNESLVDYEMSETDESRAQDSEVAKPRQRKTRPGWPKGRRRKVKE